MHLFQYTGSIAGEGGGRWTAFKYPSVFRLLQEHGTNPTIQVLEIAGDQARRWPDSEHRLRTITFLVEECGADLNYRDAEGFTPLANAAREGLDEIVECLRGEFRSIKGQK